jgi:type IV secretory pathway VirB10-like protein
MIQQGPEDGMAKVEVSRGLLVGMGSALAVVTLALAFLLGRATAHPAAAAPPAPVQAGAEAGPSLQEPPPQPPAMPASGPAPGPRPPQPPASTRSGAPVREAVAAYFHAVDQIQPGQLGGDPETLARGILGGLVKGDATGFDGLIRQTEEARANLAALTPPAPCAGYHQASLAVLADSLAMLRTVKDSLQGNGAPAADVTAQAGRLRTRTEALQAQEQGLRRQFGLEQ